MGQFEVITRENAKEFFELYRTREDKVLNWFIKEIEYRGGPNKKHLNFSRDSLQSLWSWLKDKLSVTKEVPSLEQLPLWYSNEILHNPYYTNINERSFSVNSAHLVDGLIYYVCKTLFKNITGLYWDVCTDSKQGIYYNKPWVTGKLTMCPFHNIIGLCTKAINNPEKIDDFSLMDMFDFFKICGEYDLRLKEHLQLIDQYGYPPKIEDFMRIEPSTDNSGCYHLYLAEHTEAYLGYFEFKSLKNGFRFVKSVDDLIELNNQQFIVHSSLNQTKLTQMFWNEFLLSAKDAKKKFK